MDGSDVVKLLKRIIALEMRTDVGRVNLATLEAGTLLALLMIPNEWIHGIIEVVGLFTKQKVEKGTDPLHLLIILVAAGLICVFLLIITDHFSKSATEHGGRHRSQRR